MRCVVNVVTRSGAKRPKPDSDVDPRWYARGQARLRESIRRHSPRVQQAFWMGEPPGSPSHADVPYAFKTWALRQARDRGAKTLLWLDASMFAVRPLEPLFEQIERDGIAVWHCGFSVAQWCHDDGLNRLAMTRAEASSVPLIAGGVVGLSMHDRSARELLDEWHAYAGDGVSFPGPWKAEGRPYFGHRHDMPSLSVIAHRMGVTPLFLGTWDYWSPDPKPETLIICKGM